MGSIAKNVWHWLTGRRDLALAAIVVAVLSVVLFGIIHAILITPIWWGLVGGLPRTLLTGLGMAWCYSEALAHGKLKPGPQGGLFFGAAAWLALLPAIFVAFLLRAAGWRAQLGWLEPPFDLAMVALTGAAIGVLVMRSWRGTLAAASCMVCTQLALTEPFPLEQGPLQRSLFLGVLPIFLLAGIALSIVLRHRAIKEPRSNDIAGSPNPSLQRTTPR